MLQLRGNQVKCSNTCHMHTCSWLPLIWQLIAIKEADLIEQYTHQTINAKNKNQKWKKENRKQKRVKLGLRKKLIHGQVANRRHLLTHRHHRHRHHH